MRRLLCWCVVGGVLGTGLGVSWSQDRMPFASRPPSEFAPKTSNKARKSYYAELFGGAKAPEKTEVAPEPPAQSEPEVVNAVAETPAVQITPSRGSLNLSGSPKTPLPGTDESVIFAEFEKNPTTAESGDIMQVGGQRIVRPARRTQVEGSSLTDPIAIPTQQTEPTNVAPLFDTAPDAPQAEAAPEVPADVPDEVVAEAPAPEIVIPEPHRGPVQYTPKARRAAAQPSAPVEATTASESQAPNIRVAWHKQGEVSVGRECRCQLELENAGAAAARNLEVVAIFSPNVRVITSDPVPARSDSCLVWDIAELAAGGKQSIEITMLPLGSGEITTQAEVRYSTAVSGSFQVAEPKLAIQLTGPQQTMLGESATQTILITNPGTGVAANVHIAARIPNGLEHARGGELLMEIGALHPGESRSVRLPLAAVAGGKHIVQIKAEAEGGLVEQASCAVTVVAAQMSTGIQGPSLRYLGRRATYSIVVTNDGTVPSENVRVMHKVPEAFKFVNADHGGQFDAGAQLINWFVGHIDAGQSIELAATFECKEIGEHTHFVRATNDQGAVSDSQVTTAVQGTPLLSMSVKDLEDPVETGAETAYEIEIKNEGSAAAKRIQLTCELPESLTLLDVAAPTSHRQAAGVVSFAPIEQLRPGESKTVRVEVRAEKAGNVRFRAQLSSDSVEEPLVEEELTKFYAE